MTAHEVLINKEGTEMVITDASKEVSFLHLDYKNGKLKVSVVEETDGEEKELQIDLSTIQAVNALQLYLAKIHERMSCGCDIGLTSFGILEQK